ncbi:flagellar basal body-associated protein FliL [Shewanella sp. SG44-6]|jgi:flagellar FliL protein|nr:flagellar basal body-associated protein FliL [Shewanella sp. SG44-6]MBB1390742.1 flagellar basal body-associated protein FliL [Shewanella sp. SG44-6]|tara:strand:+ start:1949 stop:2470 length:522 start_codon:yes stop_codon:yes gene_type:complete
MPEQELELNETPNAGKKSKKLFIFGGIGLVLVLLIGGGLWFFMGSDEPAATDVSADASADPAAPIVSSEAEYVGMPRPFLFNLPGADRARLVEIKVQLMVRGESNSVLTQKHIPLIEDALLTTFSAADVQKLSTQAGKDELRQLALLNVQNTLQPITGNKVVEKVLFTGFVMQ